MIRKRLESLMYITEDKFGIKDYRLSIVWIDKLIVLAGIVASIAGRIAAVMWVVAFLMDKPGFWSTTPFLVGAILAWGSGEYFVRTGNRGLIYHHMDLLVDYLDKRDAIAPANLSRQQGVVADGSQRSGDRQSSR